MIGQGLRQLQEALNRKADGVQREFTAVSEQLKLIGRRMEREERETDPAALAVEQDALRARQQILAAEVNDWRDRARGVLQQRSDEVLRDYLNQLLTLDDESVRPAVEHALYLMSASDEELARLAQSQERARPTTPAGRLIERARTEFDLRGNDPAPRRRAAMEFANRPSLAQDDAVIAEIEAALNDADSWVREVAFLTALQLHRFRAIRLADLDAAHASVERLTRFDDPAVIPILIAVLENARTGFTQGTEGNNKRSRLLALEYLAAWHTPEAQKAVRARTLDRDEAIAREAQRALDAFPGEWTTSAKP